MLWPPFAERSFDCIYAIGTLEHTPDARRAFEQLVPLLKPGGRIAVWLHPKWRPALEGINSAQRFVTKRLPVGLLLWLCRMASPLGSLKRRLMQGRFWLVRKLGVALNVLSLGVSMHPEREVRIRDTFNWYAPGHRSHHTPDEVRGWFESAGLEEIRDLSAGPQAYHEGQGRGVCLSGRRTVPLA